MPNSDLANAEVLTAGFNITISKDDELVSSSFAHREILEADLSAIREIYDTETPGSSVEQRTEMGLRAISVIGHGYEVCRNAAIAKIMLPWPPRIGQDESVNPMLCQPEGLRAGIDRLVSSRGFFVLVDSEIPDYDEVVGMHVDVSHDTAILHCFQSVTRHMTFLHKIGLVPRNTGVATRNWN